MSSTDSEKHQSQNQRVLFARDPETSPKPAPVARARNTDESSRAPLGDASSEGPTFVHFLLKVTLRTGHDLVIRDASGTSDPYVKFKHKSKLLYKSNTVYKNLNPSWNETFETLLEGCTDHIVVEVYDYDRFAADDFMGACSIDLEAIEPRRDKEMKLMLSDPSSDVYMGYLVLNVQLIPLTNEEKTAYIQRTSRSSVDTPGRKTTKTPSQIWTSTLNVVLVEARNLLPTSRSHSAPLPDPFVKFKLGTEKYKSKACLKTLEPKWLETFDLHIFDEREQTLEVMVFDRKQNLFMGRAAMDLSAIEREISHQSWYDLEDGAGQVLLVLSVTGTTGSDTVSDLNTFEDSPHERTEIIQRYNLWRSHTNLRDIGHLVVKVFKAQGLASADIGGKSDPFCVLELVNARLQTHTEYKTLNPEWNKIFTFQCKDIHSVLEVTVFDEDPNKKVEFLGKIAIPLLKIRSGEKRWYALKDRKLLHRVKGQVLLQLDLVYNPIRASIRTFNPKEEKYLDQETKFKRQVFVRHVMRVKSFAMTAVEMGQFVTSCWAWESPLRSALAFVIFLVAVYFVELYMVPLFLLMLFVKEYAVRYFASGLLRTHSTDVEEYFESDEDLDDPQFDDKNATPNRNADEKKSIKERLQAVTDTLALVQNTLDYIASTMERVKNTFNFTQPFLSCLAICVLSAATVLLYFVPLRWLIMAWGVNKFTKKLRSPHSIPNNELLDFLSRVPSDTEVRQYGEFRPDPVESIVNNVPVNSSLRRRR